MTVLQEASYSKKVVSDLVSLVIRDKVEPNSHDLLPFLNDDDKWRTRLSPRCRHVHKVKLTTGAPAFLLNSVSFFFQSQLDT